MVETKQEAKCVLESVKRFLEEKLQLQLNKKTQIFKGKQGVNFCGYKINEYRLKLRDKGKRKLKQKIKKLKREVKSGKINSHEAKKYLAGHIGYIKWADIYNLSNKLFHVEANFNKTKIRDKSQEANGSTNRVNRGGNYNTSNTETASNRNNHVPTNTNNNIGSRLTL